MGQRLSGVVLLLVAGAILVVFMTGGLNAFVNNATAALKGGTGWNRIPFPEAFRKNSAAMRMPTRLN